jgi:hypothetical protein
MRGGVEQSEIHVRAAILCAGVGFVNKGE